MSLFGNTKIRECIIGNIHLLKQIPGYSAYEIAVKHGFKGTEEEWLASLKGKDGEKGDKGDIGQMEAHGGIDALGERIKNVADPVEDGDAVNKRHFEGVIAESLEHIETHYVGKSDQLDANNMKVKNVADPTTDNDAVNKKYADENYTKDESRLIQTDEFCELFTDYGVDCGVTVYKYGKIICCNIEASASVEGALSAETPLFRIKEPYAPVRLDAPIFISNEYASNDDGIIAGASVSVVCFYDNQLILTSHNYDASHIGLSIMYIAK